MDKLIYCFIAFFAALSWQLRDSAAGAATIAVPAARATGSPASNFDPGPGWLSAEAASGRELMYVAEEQKNAIEIFHKNEPNSAPIGMISAGVRVPYGLFVDARDDLYVANQANSSVSVYRIGRTMPYITYNQGLRRPLYPLADDERVYVGNANTGTIAIFARGNPALLGTLQTLGKEVDGLNFGPDGSLYAAYRTRSGVGGIEKFPPGGFGTGVDLGIRLNAPQGLALDPAGNIYVVETQGADRIDYFRPGYTQATATVRIAGVPTQFQLGAGHVHLYVTTLEGHVLTTPFPRFDEPALWGFPVLDYDIQGIALTPTAKP